MRLSRLQEFILNKFHTSGSGVLDKTVFYNFYSEGEFKKNKKNIQDTIHKSVESLVAKDLLSAYGHKTARKWFIARAKITGKGRKLIKQLLKNKQRQLPLN
jgi:hypothetical protein